MKKTSKHTGVKEKAVDYFAVMRTTPPTESYGIEEFHKRMEAVRVEKARRTKSKD